MKIAVIGGGIAGIASAWMLAKRHEVTLFEQDDRIGGHTNTIPVDEEGRVVPVDTGFIVCNRRNYPVFYGLLEEWGVSLRDSDMSFGFSCERSGFGYVGPSLREFFGRPRNLIKPKFWGMIRSQQRFARRAMASLERQDLGNQSLGDYLDSLGMDSFFVQNYLIPLAAAVWSSPDKDMLEFPAETFLRFFDNHGMVRARDIPRWQTVVGGSCAYVERFLSRFQGRILKGTPVASIRRHADHIDVQPAHGAVQRFDHVVIATHADQSLAMLSDPSPEETAALSRWRYHHSSVVLHTDPSVMPRDRSLWASWNYRRPDGAEPGEPVPITYYMNRLQGIRSDRDYLVSLNLRKPVDPAHVIYEVDYMHPAYRPDCIDAQDQLRSLPVERRTHFCGSYLGYGFHEDAAASAAVVDRRLGGEA